MDAAPSGVKLTTALPKKISADNSTGETQNLIASVSNQGSKEAAGYSWPWWGSTGSW